jgi:hypothetical protein
MDISGINNAGNASVALSNSAKVAVAQVSQAQNVAPSGNSGESMNRGNDEKSRDESSSVLLKKAAEQQEQSSTLQNTGLLSVVAYRDFTGQYFGRVANTETGQFDYFSVPDYDGVSTKTAAVNYNSQA